jgi:hypothetical protein
MTIASSTLALQDKYELGLRDKKQPLLMALPKVCCFLLTPTAVVVTALPCVSIYR